MTTWEMEMTLTMGILKAQEITHFMEMKKRQQSFSRREEQKDVHHLFVFQGSSVEEETYHRRTLTKAEKKMEVIEIMESMNVQAMNMRQQMLRN